MIDDITEVRKLVESLARERDEARNELDCTVEALRRVRIELAAKEAEIERLRAEAEATAAQVLEEIGVYLIDIDHARAEIDRLRGLWVLADEAAEEHEVAAARLRTQCTSHPGAAYAEERAVACRAVASALRAALNEEKKS